MDIIELLEKIIDKKQYADKREIQNKLNVFYAMSVISDSDYSELTIKVDEAYAKKEEPIENKKIIKKNSNIKESEDL